MLRSLKEILAYRLAATDREIGKVGDFYFDDQNWAVRYLVADTGRWLPGQRVLIAPASIGEPDWEKYRVPIDLTAEQIENSPGIRSDQPVSRQHEHELAVYYGWIPYWGPLGMPVGAPGPAAVAMGRKPAAAPTGGPGVGIMEDVHLRSVREVLGYHIQARPDKVGHVEDFIVQTEDWGIRYLVADTRNWLPGRRVLVSPAWVEHVDWNEQLVHVGLDAEAIRHSPKFDPNRPINREYEERLYDFYGRPRYWADH